MDYDYRSRSGATHEAQVPIFRQPSSSSMYGPSLYPKVSQHAHPSSVPRPSPHHHQTSSPSPPSGLGIRVAIKPEYRITPPPHLLPHGGDIPRSNFQFDFDLERKILAEAEKQNPNFSRFGVEIPPAKSVESAPPKGPVSDPIVSKYIASGLNREAVPIAVANYGDNPTKVEEFAKGYTLLREMGFATSSIAEALIMNENDTDKALAHCLNGPS